MVVLSEDDDALGEENMTTSPLRNITTESFCKCILYIEIKNSRVRVWDLAILIPNVLFLVFLLARLKRARAKLQQTSSPIFSAFYALVFLNILISLVRCIVSMTVNAALPLGDYVDKILWLVLRFFLLSTEMSVVIFGLAFGHLDSRTSIRRVLLVTFGLSLMYSSTQAVLEFIHPDESFHINEKNYDLFGHGGMLFWFISSVFITVIYFVIVLLPWIRPICERIALPTKKSFYLYCLFLACLNLVQAIGSGILYFQVQSGLCIVDFTTFIYFTLFTPLVYRTFLSDFFGATPPPSILFSYKAQLDEQAEEDNVSLPQHSYSSTKTDSDVIFHGTSMYDSTHFDTHGTPSPIYPGPDGGYGNAMLQSQSLHSGISAIPNHSINTEPLDAVARRRSSDPNKMIS